MAEGGNNEGIGVSSAEEMDEIRKENIAYEYLCHLEEAKTWLEAILHEKLPPSTELEEILRSGVHLAKLGHFIAPETIPLSKIYDPELRRYRFAGLQFRHTDNINYWLQSLIVSGLPKTFHPETTDVYDKKGMPKVIYCLHALSTHLFKLGLAPLIQDLYGKVNFTDAEISIMKQTLETNGVSMPAFQKIGGLLTNDITDDIQHLHEAIIKINNAVDKQDTTLLLHSLKNPVSKLLHVESQYAKDYMNIFHEAKNLKVMSAVNRSLSDSYTSDVYDDLLTQAEIQGHLTSVNVACAKNELLAAAKRNDKDQVLSLLRCPWLGFQHISLQNGSFYIEKILEIEKTLIGYGTIGVRDELQRTILEGNKKAELEIKVSRELKKIEGCLMSGTYEDLLTLLRTDILEFEIHEFAAPLYFEELKADLDDNGRLVYEEMKTIFHTLNIIAAVTWAVDAGDPEQTLNAMSQHNTHLSDIEPHFKVKYWQALTQTRQVKLFEKCECPVLTYFDIQNCIDSVNQHYESSNLVIQALHSVNFAVNKGDVIAVTNALKNPVLGLADDISSDDSVMYLTKLGSQQRLKQKEGMELWLEDIQAVIKDVLCEVHEVQKVCADMSQINMALQQDDQDFTQQALIDSGFNLNGASIYQYFTVLKKFKERKMENFKSPWIIHYTKKGNKAYLNVEDFSYSWMKPEKYEVDSKYLSRRDVEKLIYKIHRGRKYTADEKLIIRLQSYIRGYLIRKSLCQKRKVKCAITIQAWWRGIKQRQTYKQLVSDQRKFRRSLQFDDVLNCYRKEEEKVIKIQAIWRGHQARKAFVSLFHKAKPAFKVVRQFAPYLNVNNDDYAKELQLQNLKAQVTQAIRHNQQLAKQLDTMDIKIGLLVQNRISLQDVVAHSKNLNDSALRISSSEMGIKGLKSLTKDSCRRLEGYQHLFYMLQTCPNYLAKLLFCLPKDKTSMFIKTFIWSLFNFGTNLREEYLLLRLFRSALQEEVRVKFTEPAELITSAPLVLHMVADYARQAIGSNSLQIIIGPLVQKVLDDKTLIISTNPVDIYRTWRNQQETQNGVISDLPPSVSPDQALAYTEVQNRLTASIQALKSLTMFFLNHITQSISLIPYGLLYIARILCEALEEKFPDIPEKDILKVVGNLVYYHYINPAIIGPETYGIITLTADNSLSNTQRLNLASIAKILQFAAVKKGFGEESPHLVSFNGFIIECHKIFKTFFRKCCDVEDLDNHFSLHQYSEATLITRPVIYITLQEICDTHKLLVDYLDHIAPDPMDPLSELLEDMGSPPTIATLIGKNPTDSSLTRFAKNEVCLTLVNKFEVPENDVTDINKLFIKAKEILVCLLPCLKGETLVDALSAPATEEQEMMYELIQNRTVMHSNYQHKKMHTTFCISDNSLQSCKTLLRQYLAKLELEGLVSQDDQYQTIITAIAHDICNHGKYREIIRKELLTLRHTKSSLDQKTKFYEEQVTLYNQYIERCLENMNAGKRNVHSLKTSSRHRKVKSKLVLKYTASRLHEKGILIEVDGLPASQFKNVQFEISPSDANGIFTICGRFMGVDLEKVDIDVQHLLQLQFNGESVMDIFGKAKVNVNLLLFLLNKKFYGKT